MGAALDGIYTLLEPLRLYRLRQGSLVDAELAAYAAGLELIEGRLEELRAQAFVQTAEGSGLARHESLVGLGVRTGMSDADRRSLILYRLSTSPFDFDRRGMENSVRAAGLEADIIENFPEESLTVVTRWLIDAFADLDAVKARVNTMLPAHLGVEYDIGELTWDLFDLADPAWDGWDGMDFTWNEFDLDGHKLFYG